MSTTMLAVIVGAATGVVLYVYVGYPFLLRLLVALRGPRRIAVAEITPTVSFVISAYNEAAVLRAKLENALALDYPADLLEIVVISDASTDRTDAIVAGYAGRGVRLARQQERRGKTAGLNRVVPTLRGEVIVFSDANAMYEPDALRRLVRNFADPQVGCVTGEARYLSASRAASELGERAYWDYEMQVKRLETALGSMVGGDGAIYAIRKTLWRELPENAINDFLNPLQIVAAGWRAVYEPAAVCYEEAAGRVGAEYRRRVRIVSRSWRAIFQVPRVLNPFAVGVFAWCVFSHKVLRWQAGLFAAAAGLAGLALVLRMSGGALLEVGVIAGIVVLGGAAVPQARRVAMLLGYFAVVNAASIVGIIKGTFGQVSGTWSTPRATAPRGAVRTLPIGVWFLIGGAVVIWLATVGLAGSHYATEIVFWTSAAVLAYVFAGYPLLLAIVRELAPRRVLDGPVEPSVCVLIAANNEAAVIDAKIRNALALSYPADRLEILVASDGSTDGTNDIVRKYAPRVRLFEVSPRRGKIGAINRAMRTVTTDVVVFTDANTFLETNAVRELVRGFADSQVGAVSGDVVLMGDRAAMGTSEDLYYRYERWIQRAESEVGSMIGVDGALYAIRRELFVPPPDDTILDDMAIPMAVIRLGKRVVFEPGALAHEQGVETAREEFSRKARVIAGAVQFLRRPDSSVPMNRPQVMFSLISHKGLRWLTPAFATAAFLASVSLASSSSGYATAASSQLLLLTLGLAGCSPTLRRVSVVALAHYFCLVQAAAAIGFLRGLTGRQSVLWRRFDRLPTGTAAH